MKDITSTSFGIAIAFFLPGLAGFYSLSFFSQSIAQLFKTFLTTQSNFGLFLLVIAASIIIGLQVTLVRWFIFEFWLCRSYDLDQSYFENLGIDEKKMTAFKAVVDEHYRYHQFWGGMAVIIPIFGSGWLITGWSKLMLFQVVLSIVGLILIEILTGWAAVVAYRLYVIRAKKILNTGG